MATDPGYAKYVCDQLQAAGGITTIKMFGEYGLYRHGKIVALIADNQFFVKPTPEGVAVLGTPSWGPPYPGARPFINASDLLDDPETLVRLVLATDAALPPPKAKKKAAVAAAPGAKKPVAKKKAPVKKAAARKKAPAKKRAPRKAAPKKKSAVAKRTSRRTAPKK
jgi:TfoX/Sxy family transcriptional regulator of competence genes